ncbi:MAG TPA: PilZ domain-containing protein [Candidatus Omnitrophota bacterium]|nr:PilZ domain-containing protein [Candidatus Omnitrophota bacterium]HPD85455.1 PilZ domain-containing protein [Candidatus Omnitrophota bacterium]HRZ04044.1 PilZ domain-containing protein [Candidatus Omnitrophota bacterium]
MGQVKLPRSAKRKKLERRRHVRVKRSLAIEHRLYRRKGVLVDGNWQISTTKDMSIVGILFHSDIPYLIGDLIQLRVVMNGALDVFKGFGRAVRCEKKKAKQPFLIAVAFIDENSKFLKSSKSS